jgi:hypothetical protein
MTLFVLLTLGQLVRLLPPTPFEAVNWIFNPQARRRFDNRGPFPVAVIYREDSEDTNFTVDGMTAGLVVGYRTGVIDPVQLFVQIREGSDPIIIRQSSPFSQGYYICEFPAANFLLTPEQITGMVEHTQTLSRGSSRPPPLPAPLVDVPGAPLYFRPQPFQMGSDEEDSEDSGSSGENDGGPAPARNVRRRITNFQVYGEGGV